MNRRQSKNNNIEFSDKVLIEHFKKNDAKAFSKLVLKYQNMIFNLCFRMIGEYDEANDCAQETFVKVYKNIKKYEYRCSFSTWIYRIAINTCKNKLSSKSFKQSRDYVRLDNPHSPENVIYNSEIRDNAFNPVELLEKKEKSELIQKAINELPSKQKTLVILRDIEGKSYQEISEITELKLGTVKSKLTRARANLRELLRDII
jgi:RNA polymerase sigma-70 factor (ECF subfamily)